MSSNNIYNKANLLIWSRSIELTFECWNKYPCRFIKHNIIIKVKKEKIYIYGKKYNLLTKETYNTTIYKKKHTNM